MVTCSEVNAQKVKDNPLLQEWNTPRQTPPFHLIKEGHYKPAIRAAIKEADKAVRNIANQKDEPTFENTIVALELSSERLDRVSALMLNMNECNTNPELQKTVMEVMPELTQHENNVWMNERLFARVKKLYENRNTLKLTKEQDILLDKVYQQFVRNGVNLDKAAKKQFAANAEELTTLTEQFNQNDLAEKNDWTLHVTDSRDLAGLPENVVAAAREEAQSRNMDGWVFTLHAPSYRPFMTYADNRALREQMWRAYNSCGNRGNKNDNNSNIRRIVELRHRQAALLGYPDYASYNLSNTMAQTPEAVSNFIKSLLKEAYPAAKRDLFQVTEYAQNHGAMLPLQNWDFSYYSEKLKKEQYGFDAEVLRPYFQLERVRQGIFDLYNRLYGLTFKESKEIEVYQEDVRAYEVFDGERFMGVLYLDMFPRPNKSSGAWMTEFRVQSNMSGREVRPLIQVCCNFSKPVGDKPALLSFDEVETFMHEFGHAMHGMLSDVHYPSVSCTNVKHDFVEMPSQVMENWCYESAFLNTFAKHYLTGDTISSEYIDKIKRSENYLAGWLCLRQLNFGLLDMAYHSKDSGLPPADSAWNAMDFEANHTYVLLPAVPGTGISTQFTHIFSGGYAAGYYGYKWAEALDADIFSRFKERGIFDKATAMSFRREILSRGGSEQPAVLFRNFMGRDPNPDALLIRCGFIKPLMESKKR